MVAAQTVSGRDQVGGLTDEQIIHVRSSFAEVPDAQVIEARQYLMEQAQRALLGTGGYVPDAAEARAWVTIHKAVSR